jgi:Kef-type K+ transport system membrane component KefB
MRTCKRSARIEDSPLVEISFTSLAIVAAVGFTAPLLLGLVSKLRLPSVVLEIVLGIVIGPSLLGWAKADARHDHGSDRPLVLVGTILSSGGRRRQFG